MTTTRIRVLTADITTLRVDAIVNAANSALCGGGGVDGAIHDAAGPELMEECRKLGRCPVGEARLSQGYNLAARFVIHAVGPVWRGGTHGEALLLAAAYQASLELARQHGLQTVAFPALSTGAYRFPIEAAARVSVSAIQAFLRDNKHPAFVLLVAFDARTSRALQAALDTTACEDGAS